MSGEIRILATSDLHLGMENSPVSRDIHLKTFQKILSLAMENDILLIAGDLIDTEGADDALIDAVNNELKNLRDKGVVILYAPGISDGEGNRSVQLIQKIESTRTFAEHEFPGPYFYELDGQKLLVYGAPASYDFSTAPIKRTDDEGFHLGLFHVHFNPEQGAKAGADSSVYMLRRDDIKSMGLDFYIFGHNHSFKMFKIQDTIIAAYPGSPEATSYEETGDRYVLSFSIQNNSIQNIRRLAVNSILLDTMEIDCSARQSFDTIVTDISLKTSKKVCLTVNLTGPRNFPVNADALKKFIGEFYTLRFTDHSLPTLEMFFNVYGYEESVRGEMLRLLKERLQGGDMPAGVSEENLTQTIKHLVSDSAAALEEWLCDT